MAWFKSKPSRPPEELIPPRIEFAGEQDGPPERELKKRFASLFDKLGTVERAYLARVEYGDATGVHVALCVKCTIGVDQRLNADVGEIFAEMFGSNQHLDTLFIRDDQEDALRQVCLPFYSAG